MAKRLQSDICICCHKEILCFFRFPSARSFIWEDINVIFFRVVCSATACIVMYCRRVYKAHKFVLEAQLGVLWAFYTQTSTFCLCMYRMKFVYVKLCSVQFYRCSAQTTICFGNHDLKIRETHANFPIERCRAYVASLAYSYVQLRSCVIRRLGSRLSSLISHSNAGATVTHCVSPSAIQYFLVHCSKKLHRGLGTAYSSACNIAICTVRCCDCAWSEHGATDFLIHIQVNTTLITS